MRSTRQAQRYPTRLVVTHINGEPETEAVLLDISPLGAKLESAAPLAPGYPIDVVVLFPGSETGTHLAGVVKWMRPLLTAAGRFQMGVELYAPYWPVDMMVQTGKI